MHQKKSSAYEKAQFINHDKSIYGTIAEIGAGQEIANVFFNAGNTSGTLAKTMSAYDMTVSDAIYGKEDCGRYVVKSRLEKMLDHEYSLLMERLRSKRPDTKLFALADTVATKRRDSAAPGHGWIGCQFEKDPGGPAYRFIVHFFLFAKSLEEQKLSIGRLGTNILYACNYLLDDEEAFIASLGDDLDSSGIQIDKVHLNTPEYANRNVSLNIRLVQAGLANAVLFDEKGNPECIRESFYKRNLLIARGSFFPPTKVGEDMLIKSKTQFESSTEDEALPVCEITLNNAAKTVQGDYDNFVLRQKLIGSLGYKTVVTKFPYFYQLSQYLTLFTDKSIGFAMGADTLKEIFKEEHYHELSGGIYEAMGRLFKKHVRLFTHPCLSNGNLTNCSTIDLPDHIEYLFRSLVCRGLIEDIGNADTSILHIKSENIWDIIKTKDNNWKTMIPEKVIKMIESSIINPNSLKI
ncbi:MAG: TonB-dependent receptor [Pseudobacteriovorax sp.]|nr:TonB-dependent receptor [Pseudobacteriovorax sp.]